MSAEILARDQLKSIVQRVERLESEISDLNADKSEIYKEARAKGFDVKAIKKVVSKRKVDEHKREEDDLVFDTYWDAVHGSNLVHVHVRENIEEFDPISGEFVDDNTPASHGEKTVRPEPAASFVEEIAASIQPETAEDFSRPAPLAVSGGEPGIPSSDDGGVKTEEAFQPSSGRSDETSEHKHAESEQATTDQPLAGGSHVDPDQHAVTHQAGPELVSEPCPVTFTLRPHYLNRELCAGHGSTHCHRCTVAMREGVAA
jgi:uncharacterized protein (UPF0335 family)